jgi:hypothetical protein
MGPLFTFVSPIGLNAKSKASCCGLVPWCPFALPSAVLPSSLARQFCFCSSFLSFLAHVFIFNISSPE